MKTENKINRLGRLKSSHQKEISDDIIDEYRILAKIYRDILDPNDRNLNWKYSQKPRNAYKIGSGGRYGRLVIHLPSLLKDSHLEAYRNGEKIYEKDVDRDTIDLLTKRFNKKKQYSELSKTVFSDLNHISGIPKHRSSQKYSFIGEMKRKPEYKPYKRSRKDLFRALEQIIKPGFVSEDRRKRFVQILEDLVRCFGITDHQKNQFMEAYKYPIYHPDRPIFEKYVHERIKDCN